MTMTKLLDERLKFRQAGAKVAEGKSEREKER